MAERFADAPYEVQASDTTQELLRSFVQINLGKAARYSEITDEMIANTFKMLRPEGANWSAVNMKSLIDELSTNILDTFETMDEEAVERIRTVAAAKEQAAVRAETAAKNADETAKASEAAADEAEKAAMTSSDPKVGERAVTARPGECNGT